MAKSQSVAEDEAGKDQSLSSVTGQDYHTPRAHPQAPAPKAQVLHHLCLEYKRQSSSARPQRPKMAKWPPDSGA